jgi:hypothetical protein
MGVSGDDSHFDVCESSNLASSKAVRVKPVIEPENPSGGQQRNDFSELAYCGYWRPSSRWLERLRRGLRIGMADAIPARPRGRYDAGKIGELPQRGASWFKLCSES